MSERDAPSSPTHEEAIAALEHLAEAFLQGPRPSTEIAARGDESELRPRAMVLLDEEGMVAGLDAQAERLLGRNAADAIGAPAVALFGRLPTNAEPVLCHLHRRDGTGRAVWLTKSELTLERNRCVVLTLDDHDPLSGGQTDVRYRNLVEQIPAVVFTAALDGGLYDIYISPQIETLLGYSQAQWVADPVLWYERLHPDDRRKLDEEFARGCRTGGPFRADCRFLTRDNKIVWVHGEARLIKDARGLPLLLQGVAFDITETKRAEEMARASLREKETLLKEIHHRVKNNLQVTSSLLKLQVDRIEDETAKKALRDAQGRIRSMALVHELLYRSRDLANVDLGEYVHDITRPLLRFHAVEPSRVRIETKAVAISLPIDIAVPCGLILNELVSNALKHAFPEGYQGTIQIELRRAQGFDELVVRDDGIGMPSGIDFRTCTTLGLRLVQTLSEQIGGALSARSNNGTEVRLAIPSRQEKRA